METHVPAAPPAKLVVEWPNNVRIEPGDFANVDWMTKRFSVLSSFAGRWHQEGSSQKGRSLGRIKHS